MAGNLSRDVSNKENEVCSKFHKGNFYFPVGHWKSSNNNHMQCYARRKVRLKILRYLDRCCHCLFLHLAWSLVVILGLGPKPTRDIPLYLESVKHETCIVDTTTSGTPWTPIATIRRYKKLLWELLFTLYVSDIPSIRFFSHSSRWFLRKFWKLPFDARLKSIALISLWFHLREYLRLQAC